MSIEQKLLEDISILVTNPENIEKQIEKCNDLDALKKISKILQAKIKEQTQIITTPSSSRKYIWCQFGNKSRWIPVEDVPDY